MKKFVTKLWLSEIYLTLNVDRFLLKQLLEKRTEVKVEDIRIRIKGPQMIAHVIFEDNTAIKNQKTYGI